MQVVHSVSDMQALALKARQDAERIGFVPTMGFLHQGHLSLIREAKKTSTRVFLSIFVNPTQFAEGEDFEDYPRDLERDLALCKSEGVDVVFAPSASEMYGKNFQTSIALGAITSPLCGATRPTHFDGVALVVTKLFNICQPHIAIFGQKDYQQVTVIKQFTEDLNIPTEIKMAPIVREADGLAMSSRNKYLSQEERENAPVIRESILALAEEIRGGNTSVIELKTQFKNALSRVDCQIDYIDIVDAKTLAPLEQITSDCVIAAAVFFGKTRLIDNEFMELGKK